MSDKKIPIKAKLTITTCDEASYQGDTQKQERFVIWDTEVAGFGLRVMPSGKKSFILNYSIQGRKRMMTLGAYGTITVHQARIEAKKYSVAVIQGNDPLADKERERLGEKVSDLCRMYIDRHAVHKKSSKDDIRRINSHILTPLGSKKALSIKRADIAALHSKIGDNNGHYEANRVLALLSKMFSLAELWGIVPEGSPNPANGVQKFKEEKRDRFITHDEMPRIIEALQTEPNQSARFAILLYLLTGLRKEELLTAKWSDLNTDNTEILIPDTKNGKNHRLPISTSAAAILEAIPRIDKNPYIITGKNEGQHLVNIDKPWQRVRKQAGIEDVRLHNLRRTVGSWLAQSGNSLHLIGKVLNHSNTSTTAIYAHFTQDSVRAALEQHGKELLAVTGLTSKAEVIPITKAAKK